MIQRLRDIQQQLLEQLRASSFWQNGQHWYQALPKRDQIVVTAVAGVVLLALVFVIIYAPLLRSQQGAEAALKKNLTVYNTLAENAYRFGTVRQGADSQAPLLATVTRYAKTAGITLSRYEQDGKALRIWIDKAVFDDAIGWLETLQSAQGVQVSQINIDRADRPGVVDIRATLTL